MTTSWIDVSAPVADGMVHWPDDPPAHIERVDEIDAGDPANVSKLDMSAHTGTHFDGPVHYVPGAPGVDALDLDTLIGPARVVAIEDGQAVRAAELEALGPREGERLLLRTRNSERGDWTRLPFDEGFVPIAPDAAQLLVDRGVGLVGIDYLSVGGMGDDGPETHRILLGAGVVVVEGLQLGGVEPGDYEMIALPVRIDGCDGAPGRVLLRSI
jgi:arylformamidase